MRSNTDGSLYYCSNTVYVEAGGVNLGNSADLHGLPERGQRILRRRELVRHKAGKAGIGDRPGDRVPVQLLRVIELVPTRHAPSVEMANVIRMLSNGANHVPFHDLHVIDVVQQLHA